MNYSGNLSYYGLGKGIGCVTIHNTAVDAYSAQCHYLTSAC